MRTCRTVHSTVCCVFIPIPMEFVGYVIDSCVAFIRFASLSFRSLSIESVSVEHTFASTLRFNQLQHNRVQCLNQRRVPLKQNKRECYKRLESVTLSDGKSIDIVQFRLSCRSVWSNKIQRKKTEFFRKRNKKVCVYYKITVNHCGKEHYIKLQLYELAKFNRKKVKKIVL